MPNTLAHVGLQLPITRLVLRGSDPRWILAGVLIPDLPWILQRAAHVLGPSIDPYELRLYAIAQSSLAVSLILCAALARASDAPRRVFSILGLNAVLHLVLDACQRKWGSGVHLLAPLSWDLLRLDLFFPESPPTYVLTGAGLVIMAMVLTRRLKASRVAAPTRGRARRYVQAAVVAALYLVIPFILTDGPRDADIHSVETLRQQETRTGRVVVFDRTTFVRDGDAAYIQSFAGERIAAVGELPARSGTVSVRAVFVHPDTLAIRDLRAHTGWPRDELSILGIALILAAWIRRGAGSASSVATRNRSEHDDDSDPQGSTGPGG